MRLERDHVDRNHLRRNAIMKLTIVVTAIAGAIAFGSCYGASSGVSNDVAPTGKDDVIQSVAASLEWFIACELCLVAFRSRRSVLERSTKALRSRKSSPKLTFLPHHTVLFDLYIFTYVVDFWPATKTVGHKFTPSLIEKDRLNQLHHHKDGRPGAPGGIDEEYPQHGFGADNTTPSNLSYPDSIGGRVGRPSEEAHMRHV